MVALAAAAGHGVGSGNEDAAGWLETASILGLVHTVGLVGIAALARAGGHGHGQGKGSRLLTLAALAFGVGIVLFSGILAIRALADWDELAPVTPFGGVAFMIGWVLVAAHGIFRR